MTTATYGVYLLISLLVTVLLGQTLHRHGRIFVVDCMKGDSASADAINNLLLVGFYLVNLAFITIMLRSDLTVQSLEDGLELLATKLGIVLLTLGLMHFVNLIVLGFVKSRDF